MLCPECGAEFREGFTQCNDCGVELVEGNPDPAGPTWAVRELAVVGRFLHPAQAATLRCALRGAGFRCWLLNEHVVSIYWTIAPAIGGIYVTVDAEDLEEVEAWLKDASADYAPLPSDEYQALRNSPKRRMASLLTWFVLIPNVFFVLIIAALSYRRRQRRTEQEDLEEIFE